MKLAPPGRVSTGGGGGAGGGGGRSPTTTRVERLLRERQLRKFNRAFHVAAAAASTASSPPPSSSSSQGDPPADSGTEASTVAAMGGIFENQYGNHQGINGRVPDGAAGCAIERDKEYDASSVGRAASVCEGCDGVDDGRATKQRLLVVANRLPVSAVRRGEDSWSLEISAGGLVSALLGVKEFEAKWIGWAGVNVPDEIGQRALTEALAEKRCIPVFLDEEIVHQYYNGYCNNILWPLFHYLGLPQEDRLATTRSFQSQFDAYKRANQMFADVVSQHYEEGDVVWCHDYHLMFLPKCLKDRNSKMKVGWFLHTPFPSSEIHRTLPSRSELLRSVLAADLVG